MNSSIADPADGGRRGRRRGVAYMMLLLVLALWAGNSIVARAVAGEVPPMTLALMRWSGAFLIVAPFAARAAWAERRAVLAAWRPVLLLGVLGVACFNAFLYAGLQTTTASNAMLLQGGLPALVLAANLLLFRIRPSGAELVGVLVSAAGVAAIVSRGDPGALARLGFDRGDLLVLAGVTCWAGYTVLLRLRPEVGPTTFLWATFAVGVVAMLPLAALEWRAGAGVRWTPASVGAVAYVAVLPSVVAYGLFNAAVKELGAAATGQTLNLLPVLGAALSAGVIGEPLHAYHAWGMALILIGIAMPLVFRRGPARTPRRSQP